MKWKYLKHLLYYQMCSFLLLKLLFQILLQRPEHLHSSSNNLDIAGWRSKNDSLDHRDIFQLQQWGFMHDCVLTITSNKEILSFLQNRLPLLYCTSVSVKLFQLHCCVYKVFAVPLVLLLFQQCFTFITVSTKLLVLLGNFNCFIDVSTTQHHFQVQL